MRLGLERPPSEPRCLALPKPESTQVNLSALLPAPDSCQGTHGFTLDPLLGEWVLSHPAMACPQRGQIYSVNDARYFDWPVGLQKYIDTIRQVRVERGAPAVHVVVLHPLVCLQIISLRGAGAVTHCLSEW